MRKAWQSQAKNIIELCEQIRATTCLMLATDPDACHQCKACPAYTVERALNEKSLTRDNKEVSEYRTRKLAHDWSGHVKNSWRTLHEYAGTIKAQCPLRIDDEDACKSCESFNSECAAHTVQLVIEEIAAKRGFILYSMRVEVNNKGEKVLRL